MSSGAWNIILRLLNQVHLHFRACLLFLCVWMFLRGTYCPAQNGGALPESPSPQPGNSQSFFKRLTGFYRQDWHGTAAQGPAPPRRGPPSPLESPPFPNSDWSYGGSPVIGEPDTNSYPLMTAWNGARSRTKLYGWVEPSLNFSTSADSNAPVANDVYSNRFELNQVVVYVERLPDSVQREHVDVGYHLTAFYGTDYKYTTDKGYFSNQLLVHDHQYGFDPVLEYVDIYFPHVADGMNLRVGRYISIPGIEAQLTPNNYMFSHSLLYAIDPFTDTGVLATVKLNDQWLVQARHFRQPRCRTVGRATPNPRELLASATPPLRSITISISVPTASTLANTLITTCSNTMAPGITNSPRAGIRRPKAYFMYQRDVPSVGGPFKPEPNDYAATCHPGLEKCLAPEYAAVNYILKQLSEHDFIGFRSDLLNDKKGQRTGFNTKYTENTLMWSHWIGTTVQIRPEIRFDHAWDRKSYDRGKRQSQLTVASDLVFHF